MYYCCVLLRFNNSNKRPFPTEYSELQQFLNSENVPARVSWSLRRATPLALFRRWFFDESFSECYAIASWSNTIIFIVVIITLNKLDQLAEWPIVWELRTKTLSHTRGGDTLSVTFMVIGRTLCQHYHYSHSLLLSAPSLKLSYLNLMKYFKDKTLI